jgi:hypothetical protein
MSIMPAGAGSAILLWVVFCGFALWYVNRPGKSAADQGLKLWAVGLVAFIALAGAAAFVGSP